MTKFGNLRMCAATVFLGVSHPLSRGAESLRSPKFLGLLTHAQFDLPAVMYNHVNKTIFLKIKDQSNKTKTAAYKTKTKTKITRSRPRPRPPEVKKALRRFNF